MDNETQFGVAKPLNDYDEQHTNNQLYSCGSLAPKLKRGGGCMDHGFQRNTEAWERSDGCVYLIRELSKVAVSKDGTVINTVSQETKEKSLHWF